MGLRNGPSNIKSADFLFHFKNHFAVKYVIQSSHAPSSPAERRHTGILFIFGIQSFVEFWDSLEHRWFGIARKKNKWQDKRKSKFDLE